MPGAPTTAVDPDRVTELPKWSPVAPSAAVSSARCDQVLPERVNTYAAPVFEFLPGAPTTAVDPEMATEPPNPSPVAWPDAVSLACWKALPAAVRAWLAGRGQKGDRPSP